MEPLARSATPVDSALVVDDERAVRELIARILGRLGYRSVIAESPEAAIEHVERDDFSVVLTDINMPGYISGLELIDELHARRPSLPIILVTGTADEENLQDALNRGAAGFVTKPFKAKELGDKVAAVLGRMRLVEDELRERLLAPTVASVLANAIEVRDEGMVGHTERLASLALAVGRRIGLSDAELEPLGLGAILHDIGKIGIPDNILKKPGPLTAEERLVMQEHPVIGDRMVSPLGLQPIREVVRHHHERWDGDGYPDRLAGDRIPILARIVAVADSIEAMSGDRPYRRPLGEEAVVKQLALGRAGQWDPELVDVVLDLIAAGRIRFTDRGLTVLDDA
jgi:putative two-component system response regulator